MKTRRTLAAFLVLAVVTSLSVAVPAYQGKSKGKAQGKEDTGQSQSKKGGKADSEQGGGGPGRGAKGSGGGGGGTTEDAGMAPLFKGKLGLRSSAQSKDQATLGFNGADEEGNIRAEVLKTQPGPEDERKAHLVASYRVKPDDVQAFVRSGKLKGKPAEKKSKSQ